MRKYEKKEITKVERAYLETSITCNKCGKTKQLEGEDYEREWQSNVFQSFTTHFGYGTRHDTEKWNFDLCEDCLTELVRSFKHLPDGFREG
ncbi:hypothetical protein [Alkalihalobacillus deserti]|uniref:hypothetical protein n=1 Tax=Alkalihalobacillus deserti TaxID=2879466 RepID=UPI001D15030A|nr:hypothetical protein [Alkalihalobacillus deserti]